MKSTGIHNEIDRYAQIQKILAPQGKPLYVGTFLHRAAQLYGERCALIFKEKCYTYAQLSRWANQCAAQFRKQGLTQRKTVLISLHNCPAYYAAYFGTWQSGGIVAPLNTFLGSAETKHIIEDANPAIIVTEGNRVQQFRSAGYTGPIITQEEIEQYQHNNTPATEDLISLEPNELCALLYTSGTTGVPKGVMLSSHNITTNIAQLIARLDITTDITESIAGVLPLFHVFAQNTCLWSPFFLGVTVVLAPHIDRQNILEVLKHKPTLFVGVPALYGLLCLMRTAPLDSIKLCASGGDALPDKIRSAFELIYRRKLVNGYGLTETSPLVAVMLEDALVPTNTIGKPACGITVQIRAEDGTTLMPAGQSGVLWVKGDNIMLGYHNAPEITASVLKDGFFDTGDCAYLDTQGRLVITGREKDLIISKGINVYPQEIENVLMNHPLVLGAGVVGMPDPDFGEQVVAFVQVRTLEPGLELTLKKLCQQMIANYKVPRIIICQTEELPMTATRKVDKKQLRSRLGALNKKSV
jgi:long-chain acyl-CoA synthetase